jgi:integrase
MLYPNSERKTVLLTDPKNGESRRLPIDSKPLRELSEHRTRVKNDELVFPSYDRKGKVVPLNDVKGSFDLALTDAGITNFRFHDVGWGGWIRTNTGLINSEVPYQLDHAPAVPHSKSSIADFTL